ncbi:Serine protease precursor [Vibrio nigripulchritudo ATCC 27043]|uniref:S8 family peptidase n=1 Tax=Vibrio nigripulchritudo TaxID=28173 RepID=UPI00021C3E05|nr:S8 family peptidase [Vibrio nigripulchritudo]EGU61321.1 Serine protease precursor [Vibrio nigripulchritudo ATCC 27043]
MKLTNFKHTAVVTALMLAGVSASSAFAADSSAALVQAQNSVQALSRALETIPSDNVQLIVKYKASATAKSGFMASIVKAQQSDNIRSLSNDLTNELGNEISYKRAMLLDDHHVVKVGSATNAYDLENIIQKLKADPNVESVELDGWAVPFYTPADPQYSSQWHYSNNTTGIRAPQAWNKATGQGVTVSVVDTGFTNHPDLTPSLVSHYDFITNSWTSRDGDGRDSNGIDAGDRSAYGECGRDKYGNPIPARNSTWHGTHVLGTVGAVEGNGQYGVGVAFDATLTSARVLGRCGGSLSDIADGIMWAAGAGNVYNSNPAQVINLSLGGSGACGYTYQNAINAARNKGAVVVIAAGNDRVNTANVRPANCQGVITVGASDQSGNQANFSNFGSEVDIMAPGVSILSTVDSGTATPQGPSSTRMSGTSMATPHVAGVAALVKQAFPAATPDQVESIIKDSARPFPGSCSNGGCGAGMLDANAAVDRAIQLAGGGTPDPDPNPNQGGTASAKNLSGAQGSWDHYNIDIPAGMSKLVVSIAGGTGDADLYVKFGSQPSTYDNDCAPWINGNAESCVINNPSAGKWHMSLNGYQAYSNVDLTVTWTP